MTRYFVTDADARSYLEGQTFNRAEAITEAHKIAEHHRPNGVWIVPEDEADGPGEEIFPPTGA